MPLTISDLIWDDWNEAHIAHHHVTPEEVEEICYGKPWTLRARGQDTWALFGQTDGGRYLVVILADRGHGIYYPVTARPMSDAERRRYQS